MGRLKLHALLGLSVVLTAVSRGEELPGYPQDVLKNKAQYECIETTDKALKTLGRGAEWVQIFDVCVDKKFTENAINLAHQAFDRFRKNLISKPVFECLTNSRAIRKPGLDKHDEFLKTTVLPALTPRQFTDAQVPLKDSSVYQAALVFISALDTSETGENYFGEGYSGLFSNPKFNADDKNWRRHISVALRKDLLDSQDFAFGTDLGFWNAMIAVGYLKNMGLLPNSGDTAVPQTIAAAACFRWDGNVPSSYLGYITRDGKDQK